MLGQIHIMGGDQGGDACVLDQGQKARKHLGACRGIKIAGGLVGQEDTRAIGKGAGYGNPLLLTARQLRGLVVKALGQTKAAEQDLGMGARGLLALTGYHLRQGDIVQGAELGQQMVELIDKADLV